MKTELAKLELYRTQLANLKDSLTDIPNNVYSPGWKPREENIDKLEWFLDNNNCLVEEDYKGCYLQTRLLLIATTKELDSSNDLINALNKTIDKLTVNINFIIDEFKKTGETE